MLLPSLNQGVNGGVVAAIVGQGIVNGQREERLLFVKSDLQAFQQAAVGLDQRILGHLGIFSFGEGDPLPAVLLQAALDVGPAALHHQCPEQIILR